MLDSGGSSGNGQFIKRSLTGAILTMFLMAAFLSIYLPDYGGEPMEKELDSLLEGYTDMTGSNPTSEEIWGLTGIYTPYGKGSDGEDSTAWGTTADGWVYGARLPAYTPSQYVDLNGGKEAYTVTYDEDTGLYYYTEAGSDLSAIKVSESDPQNPEEGTLYTQVAMDYLHKSSVFFTAGGKQTTEDGSYYNFTGWRYVWQPLRDYKASNDLNVDKTTTSLSMVWYDYYGTSGLSGQLMLCGSDSGLSYITTKEITESFNSSTFSSKFTMIFNGVDMYVHIKLNPYAIQFQGKSPAQAFNEGLWSVMVTSPSVTTDTAGFTLEAFSPDRVVEIVFNLLTFSMDGYGLSGTASILCSVFFTVGFYTSLIAICVDHLYLLVLLTAAIGVLQGLSIFT